MLPFFFFSKSRGRGVLSNARKNNWELGTLPEQPPSPQNHLAAVSIPAPGLTIPRVSIPCSQGMEKVGSPPVILPGQDPAHCLPPLGNCQARMGSPPCWDPLELCSFSRDARADTTMELLPVPTRLQLPGEKKAVQEFGEFRWDQ